MFEKFEPATVHMKKPVSNVPLMNVNSLPCSCYVSFRSETMAIRAMEEFNGKIIPPGFNRLRIEPYQRSNRFFGPLSGLNRYELISNTHFRVLFIRGLFKNVTEDRLKEVCSKYGDVQTLSIKTKV